MRIVRDVLTRVVAHAHSSRPFECCGILLSRSERATVDDVLPAENVERRRPQEAYILGPKAHLKAIEIESRGEADIVGYYHSHPKGGTYFSATDRISAIDGTTYLVISGQPADPVYAAWRTEGRRALPEPVEVVS